MGRRKSVAWALLLVVALAGGCGREVSFKAAEKGGGAQIDWSSVTPAEVEELIAKGELDVKGFYQGKGDKEILFSTPMRVVNNGGNLDVFDVLMEHGADIDYYILAEDGRTKDKMTALDFTVHRGDVEMARRLLELGAFVANEHNDREDYPTIFYTLTNPDTTLNNRKAMIELLLAYGDDINTFNYSMDEPSVATNLLTATVIKMWTNSENYEGLVPYMVSRGAEINIFPSGGIQTVMHIATWSDNVDIIRELIHLGGDVNVRNAAISCYTPLFYFAVGGQSIDIFDELVANGADLDHRCDDGYNIFDFIAIRRSGKLFDSTERFSFQEISISGYERFATKEEWSDFADKIIERIAELCEESIYEICHDLEEGT